MDDDTLFREIHQHILTQAKEGRRMTRKTNSPNASA